jgi:CubicO group peptidase (beta-lactamase class C family)
MTDKRRRNAEAHLEWLLGFLRQPLALPALAAGFTIDGEVAATAVVGVRKWGDPTPVERDDRFLLGSITKPLTGLLFARASGQAQLGFTSSLGQVFPELIESLERPLASFGNVEFPNPAAAWARHYATTTVTDLMNHTAGLAFSPGGDLVKEERALAALDFPPGSTPSRHRRRKRLRYTELAVADEPFKIGTWKTPPGKKRVLYSGGCIIVASMLETRLGKAWETLMSEWVFEPLGVQRASFGELSEATAVTEPWHHQAPGGSGLVSTHDLRISQVAWTHAPAGALCLSMDDLGRILGRISVRDPALLDAAGWTTYLELPGDSEEYTRGGWSRKGNVIKHNGNDNGWNHADCSVDLDRQLAVYACANLGSKPAKSVVKRLKRELVHIARAYDLFQHADEAIDPARMRIRANSTREADDKRSYDPLLMADPWMRTGWEGTRSFPTITVEFDEPTEVSGIVLYQPRARAIRGVDFPDPTFGPVRPPLGRVEPTLQIGPVHAMSANGHVLHVRLPSRRTVRELTFRIRKVSGMPCINRLLVLR